MKVFQWNMLIGA